MNPTSLTTVLWDHYKIIAVEHRLIQERDGQQVFLATGKSGSFVVKRYALDAMLSQVANNVEIANFIYENGFPSPEPMRAVSGELFVFVEGRHIAVQRFLEGEAPEASPEAYEKLAVLVARLHEMDVAPIRANLDMEFFKEELHRKGERYGIEKQYFEWVDVLPDFRGLPKSIIHTDLELRNVIEHGDGSFSLIDWDDAGTGITLLDAVYPFVSLIDETGVVNRSCCEAFYQTYFSRRKLVQEEWSLFGAAVMFWLLSYSVIDQVGIIDANWQKAKRWMENGSAFLLDLEKLL